MALWRESVAVTILTSFLLTPGWSVADVPFGTVLTATRAHVGTVEASPGGTLFPGDRLSTDENGAIQVRTGAARFLLLGSSSATLQNVDGSPAAMLSSGRAVFSAANAEGFVVFVSRARIRPHQGGATVGQVAIEAPKQFVVWSKQGSLSVTVDEETQVIPEGTAYRVILDPVAEPAPQGSQGPRGCTKSSKTPRSAARSCSMWIPIVAAGAVAVWVIHEAWESPDRP